MTAWGIDSPKKITSGLSWAYDGVRVISWTQKRKLPLNSDGSLARIPDSPVQRNLYMRHPDVQSQPTFLISELRDSEDVNLHLRPDSFLVGSQFVRVHLHIRATED